MIPITFHFSLTEASKIFVNAGVTVTNLDDDTEILCVVNPHTGKKELLETAFRKIITKNKTALFSELTKVEIYNSFKQNTTI